MLTQEPKRRGVTLLELLVVITLMGILSSVVITRFGRTLLGNFGSQADARRISLDLLQANRRSITTGDNHFLQFSALSGKGMTYDLIRRAAGGDELFDSRTLSEDVTVTVSATVMEFNFEGQALGAYVVDLQGDNRSWQLAVIPISGAVRVTETTP